MTFSVRERWSQFKKFDKNLVIYFFLLTILIFVFHKNLRHGYLQSVFHLFLIALCFFCIPWFGKQQSPFLRWFRYWYIIAAFPFLYMDVGQFIHLIWFPEFDPVILKVDHSLFGVLPNIWLQQYVKPLFTEFMQISYSIYWITIPLGGLIFYLEKDKRYYENLLSIVTITFFFSYFIFIFFPVAGPRFYLADQITSSYHGIFFADYLRSFMKSAGFRGGAFPSSHVGVAVAILMFVLKFKPRLAIFLFLPMVLALSLATVYGQYHYLTDVIAGFVMGISIGLYGSFRTAKQVEKQPDDL